jgi:hypothetical protein
MSNNWPELGLSEEVTFTWKRGPKDENITILNRAIELAESVPYTVTLRWLFYGLWQEGLYSDVKPTSRESAKARAYGRFKQLMSTLRHSSQEYQSIWPIELADDRRDPIHRSNLFRNGQEWINAVKRMECNIDKMVSQDYYVMVAFEAEAMLSQFRYITEPYGVSLWPFSGHASIPYKKRFSEYIERVYDLFGLPVIVLYFGDYDEAGEVIPESAFRHIRKWCPVCFKAYRCGLNADQVVRYNIEEDVDKTGKYQWEAVRADAAEEIITGALDSLLYHGAIKLVEEQERETTEKVRGALSKVVL